MKPYHYPNGNKESGRKSKLGRKKSRPVPQDLGMPPGGADSHVHLDFPAFKGKIPQVLDRAKKSGVSTFGQVFLGPSAYLKGRDLFKPFPEVFYILGVHPHEASGFTPETCGDMAAAVKHDQRIRAIGETGFDFFYRHSSEEKQKNAFKAQLELAREMELPVVIHSREAEAETIKILKQTGFKNKKVLWHCFGQGLELGREILDQGWHISIPGSITFPKNALLREALAEIPPGRLLLETDCPFIAPEPYRGKRNEPAFMVFTALAAAEIMDMDAGDLWRQCGDNCRDFFGVN